MAHRTVLAEPFRTSDTPIQRGFALHSVMLAPMIVKNIPITMAIAVQLMTWIVAIARLEILERMDASEPEALSRPCGVSPISWSSNGYREPG